jgi:hypothetical protein
VVVLVHAPGHGGRRSRRRSRPPRPRRQRPARRSAGARSGRRPGRRARSRGQSVPHRAGARRRRRQIPVVSVQLPGTRLGPLPIPHDQGGRYCEWPRSLQHDVESRVEFIPPEPSIVWLTWASAAPSVASGRLQARVIQRRNPRPEQTSSARETVRSPDQLIRDARIAGRMSSIVHNHQLRARP